MKSYFLVVFTGILLFTHSWAQQTIDHRYTIQGFVLDENDRGIVNQEVKVYKGRLLLEMAKTNTNGFYSLNLNLRNDDNRQLFMLRSGSNEAEVKVTFDPQGEKKSTVHKANFVAGKFIEGELKPFSIPSWIYPLGGLLAIGFLAVKLEKRRKRKIQKKKERMSGRSSSHHHKSKKRRRKKA